MKTRSNTTRFMSLVLSLLMVLMMLPEIGIRGIRANAAFTGQVGELIEDYLTFTAQENNSTVAVKTYSGKFQYQTKAKDAESYGAWSDDSNNTSIDLSEGDSVRFRGNGVKFTSGNHVSITTGSVACSGDVCSLRLDNEGKFQGLESDCFQYMFYRCTGLTTAPELKATTLANYCYYGMFYDCTSLTAAPALPATTLANNCYTGMFYGCTSLTAAPALPVTTLANSCYYSMFAGCTGLTAAPKLPATELADSCYCTMFSGCTSLTAAPALPATNLADSCYMGMFYGCTSLTAAPELPATTLADSCYMAMFYDCTGIMLSETKTDECKYAYRVPSSGEGTPAEGALDNMFTGTGGTFTGTPTLGKTYYMKKSPKALTPGTDFTAPTAVANLKYTGNAQDLVTALTWAKDESDEPIVLGDVYYGIGEPAAIEKGDYYELTGDDLTVGKIFKPTNPEGILFPVDKNVKLGNEQCRPLLILIPDSDPKQSVWFRKNDSGAMELSYINSTAENATTPLPDGCDALRIDKIDTDNNIIEVTAVKSSECLEVKTWTTTPSAATEIGTYPVYYKISATDKDKYADLEATKIADVTIGKGVLDITAEPNANLVYDGEALTAADFTFSGTNAALAQGEGVTVKEEVEHDIVYNLGAGSYLDNNVYYSLAELMDHGTPKANSTSVVVLPDSSSSVYEVTISEREGKLRIQGNQMYYGQFKFANGTLTYYKGNGGENPTWDDTATTVALEDGKVWYCEYNTDDSKYYIKQVALPTDDIINEATTRRSSPSLHPTQIMKKRC